MPKGERKVTSLTYEVDGQEFEIPVWVVTGGRDGAMTFKAFSESLAITEQSTDIDDLRKRVGEQVKIKTKLSWQSILVVWTGSPGFDVHASLLFKTTMPDGKESWRTANRSLQWLNAPVQMIMESIDLAKLERHWRDDASVPEAGEANGYNGAHGYKAVLPATKANVRKVKEMLLEYQQVKERFRAGAKLLHKMAEDTEE